MVASSFVWTLFVVALAVAAGKKEEGQVSITPGHIRPRHRAPGFTAQSVIDDKFNKIQLKDYAEKGKWVVLLFYPVRCLAHLSRLCSGRNAGWLGAADDRRHALTLAALRVPHHRVALLPCLQFAFTFVCPTEIISFSEHNKEFEAINTQVLAISTDSHHTQLAWTRAKREDGGVGRLAIPLVADTSKTISAAYGVLVTDEDDDMYGAALRGLFVIDPQVGVGDQRWPPPHASRFSPLLFCCCNLTLPGHRPFCANQRRRRRPLRGGDAAGAESVPVGGQSRWRGTCACMPQRVVSSPLRCLCFSLVCHLFAAPRQACPASWKPGDDTIRANPYESREYFRAHYSDK